MRHWAIAWLAIGARSSAPAMAKERMHRDDDRGHRGDDRSATIEMLEHREDALQRKAMVFRIGPVERQQIAEQRDKIDDLIDDLEAGRNVDRYELDEALGYPYHEHGYPYPHHHHFEG